MTNYLQITADDDVDLAAVFSDSAKRLAMVTDARVEFLGRDDRPCRLTPSEERHTESDEGVE